jgi:hypothetical protein
MVGLVTLIWDRQLGDVIETARADQLIVFKCPSRTFMREMNALGTVAVFNSRNSLI